MEDLKSEISKKIEEIEESGDEETREKMERMKELFEKHMDNDSQVDEKNIEKNINRLKKMDSRFDSYKRYMEAFAKPLDIDPGRIMGLTDGIFGMVMTLLIFGISLPDAEIVNYSGFLSFASSILPTVGITIVSFILLASFWIYHHEFIKIKTLNMPFLWINILFLASLSFIPFTTSIVGNYSHFFLANVIFGVNIFLALLFFYLIFHYAHKRGFLEEYISEGDKKYVYHTLYILMGVTIVVNLLDFNINHNFIYLFLLVPIISIIRDIMFRMKH